MIIRHGNRSRARQILEETAAALHADFPHLYDEQIRLARSLRGRLKNSKGKSTGGLFSAAAAIIPELKCFLEREKYLGPQWFASRSNLAFFLKVWPDLRIKPRS